jgi:hypothetical protein
MDKLVIVTGIIALSLGVCFMIAHQIYPQLSDAYLSGGAASIGIGAIILIISKLRESKNQKS